MTTLKKPQYRRPLIKTERIELRCSPEQKEALHAYAHLLGMTCSAWLVSLGIQTIAAAQKRGDLNE